MKSLRKAITTLPELPDSQNIFYYPTCILCTWKVLGIINSKIGTSLNTAKAYWENITRKRLQILELNGYNSEKIKDFIKIVESNRKFYKLKKDAKIS